LGIEHGAHVLVFLVKHIQMRAILCHDSNQSVKMASGKQINPVISPNLNNPDSSKLVFNQDFDTGMGDWLTDVQVQDIDVASALPH